MLRPRRRLVLIEELVPGLTESPCALALDIDGILTMNRRGRGFDLDLEVTEMLRRLEAIGVRVMLVTGNAVILVADLARYLGLSGPHVAESGCLVIHEGMLLHICGRSAKPAAEIIMEKLGSSLEPAWHNEFRIYDYIFLVRAGEPRRLVAEANKLLREEGYEWAKAVYDGYAIHIQPIDADKGKALAKALEVSRIPHSCVLAVGVSETDSSMASIVKLAAVGNADPSLKENAHIILRRGGSKGVLELLLSIMAFWARG